MRRSQKIAVLAAASGSVVGFAGSGSRAATSTWDNGGGNLLWSNAVNWSADTAVDGNDAKFGLTGSTTSNSTVTSILDSNKTINSLGFNQSGATAGTVVYHTLQINDGVTLTINGSSGANGSTL